MENPVGIPADSNQIDETKRAAKKMLNEGSYLQSLEIFSKILVEHPNDQEALEGKVTASLELKLFHRCLKDVETLSHLNPHSAKIHNLAGQIYEQIGSNERSICAYLKAYLYEQDVENRPETVQKISRLCSTVLPEHKEMTGNLDCFQSLFLLSEKLAEQEKFQVCLEILITLMMTHCLDEKNSKAFKNKLNVCSKMDNVEACKNIEACTFQQNMQHENIETKNNRTILSRMETLKESKLDAKIRSSLLQNMHSGNKCETASVEEKNSESVPDSDEEFPDSVSKEPTITFLPNSDQQTINEMLLQASDCCHKLGRKGTSLWFARKQLEHVQASNNSIHVLKAYDRVGTLYVENGDYDAGVFHYTKVRAKCREVLATKITMEQEIEISAIERRSILKLCSLFKDLELYEQAKVYLKEFFSKVEVVEQQSLVKAYSLLGEVELAQNLYEEAVKTHRTQLALCLKYDDQKGLVLAYKCLGKAHLASGDNVAAMEWFQLSIHTAKILNDPFCLATAYNCIGEELLSQNNPQHALTYFQKQLDLSTTMDDEQTLRIQALYCLGKSYQNLRLFQHSEFFFKRAILESKDLKMHLQETYKESLVQVLLILGKREEALELLLDIRDTLEATFQRIRGHTIVVSHPLLDRLNTCVDQILELLAEEGRLDEALEVAETTNSMLLKEMLTYKAHVQGSEMDSIAKECMDLSEIYRVVNDSNKVVLYYRVVRNGFIVWVVAPTHGIVHYHWFKPPSNSSLEEIIEEFMNGLLQPSDQLVNYSCDHRKVFKGSTLTQDTPPSPTASHRSSPQGSTSKSRCTPQSSNSMDFLRELSKLFIFPIEESLIRPDSNGHDVIIINNAFLSMVPFADLHFSNGTTIADFANSVQLLPCISVLKITKVDKNFPKGMAVIGNPEMRFSEMQAGFQGHMQQDFLEQELNDVAVVLGTIPEVGSRATKDMFLNECNSTTLMHLSTYGSHEHGTITLAPIPDIDPRVGSSRGFFSRDPWEITLADIVALQNAPEVLVLSAGSGCRNEFRELVSFNTCLPLAFMLAGVKTVVMATWSTPQNALMACLRQFYKNISDGLTVSCALSRAKTHVQAIEGLDEPLFWASFRVYGQDSLVNVEEIRRSKAEESFYEAQEIALERFRLVPRNKESSDGLVTNRLKETVIELLHRHHLHPDLIAILLQVIKEALTILETPSDKAATTSLPYREITASWLTLILKAEKFLLSVGFLIKTTSSRQTILVYPHWNQNGCLEKVESLLQSVFCILFYSPVLADALRVVLSDEKSLLVDLRDTLQKTLTCPYEVIEICNTTLLRKFWLKRSTRRLMAELGFRQVGYELLEFRNSKEDRNAAESCLNIFGLLSGLETSTEIKQHPMLSKVNLRASWMSYRVSDEENTARYHVAHSLDSINAKYKLAMTDVRKWHNGVLLTQAKVAKSKNEKEKEKLDHASIARRPIKQTETSKLPEINNRKGEPIDLVKLGEKLTKIKVQSGAGPSSVRRPVEKEASLPLVECLMKRHEAAKNLRQCLGGIRSQRREEIRKLLSL
ncbi:tetratricopeptide repeat protein 28-like [Dendronephthya gigantea]|uniref:tetratricopeptide repeat protein 28-like n=1 Tax=Dendronephthya gigantea TaxID=151771 RepID=UPI00106B7502|nr:tetratricopeptide repeat protein 28-like [Dendronephthya gigantea]